MGFEKEVLRKVDTILGTTELAHFMCGSLFVECSGKEAITIKKMLVADYGKVQMIGGIGEYAFDFVA